MKKYNVAILGATGAVGQEFLNLIEERKFPFANLKLLASKRSAGKKIQFMGKEYTVEEATENSFNDVDIALFAGGSISKTLGPAAAKAGAVVIDNSSTFRMDPEVPLIVPEVNPEDISWHKGIIANPNCSTIQAVVPLKFLDTKYSIKRIVYSTYQAVSGAGSKAIHDLENGIKDFYENNNDNNNNTNSKFNYALEKFKYPIFDNCLPHIDIFLENGYTKEEEKMINETRKILRRLELAITATTVRVPVFNSHSESINIEFENEFKLEKIVEILENAPGVKVIDSPEDEVYAIPTLASGHDEVFVSRIRRDFSIKNGLNIWVVADNIRKGAASNAVQILEQLIK